MLAAFARLQLPIEPFHVPRWRQASLLQFTLNVHHVMRVGHLESPMVWCSLLYPSPARLPLVWGITQLPLPMPHDLPTAELVASAKWLVRALLTEHPGAAHSSLPEWIQLGEALPGGSQSPGWLRSCAEETPARIAAWLDEHAVGQSQDLHLLTMAVGVLISLLTHKTELIVRGVYGEGKTQCIALLAAFLALRGHQVYYAARENTTIVAMATFVHQLLPRELEDAWPDANRLVSQPQARTNEGTPLDARDTDKNQEVWHAKLVLATTGLHLAQFRHKLRPLAKAVDYADIFIYDEAQQEAALSDLAILGALPRKCLVLRLGDPKQTSGGTGSSDLACQVRHISDQLALGIRAARKPYLPQMLPMLLQSLLLDDLPPEMTTPLPEHTDDKGVGTVGATGALPGGRKPAATVPLSADAGMRPLACCRGCAPALAHSW